MIALLAAAVVVPGLVGPHTNCSILPQVNCVSGTPGLGNHGSTATVKFLGVLPTPEACQNACDTNSTPADPCHSWAYYYPDTASGAEWAGACFGRHDSQFDPISVPLKRNHVCSAGKRSLASWSGPYERHDARCCHVFEMRMCMCTRKCFATLAQPRVA